MTQHLDLDALHAELQWCIDEGHSGPRTHACLKSMATIIDRLRKAEAASKWISVDERLPEEEGWYAVMVSDPDDVGWETRCWWRALWKKFEQEWSSADPVEDGQPVTHWRLIAAPHCR